MLDLDPEVNRRVDEWIRYLRSVGITLAVTSTRRSTVKQTALYKAWLARGKRGLPAAPPGTSTHEYGLAIDVVPVRGRIEDAAAVSQCFGLIWFGPKDPVHFDVWGKRWKEVLRGNDQVDPNYRC